MNRWAISDIHGCAKTLQTLVEDQIQFTAGDELYLLGDYIDRGPNNKEVVDWILQAQNMGYSIYTLKGNHEDMLLKAMDDPETHELWAVYNGGISTLKSFHIAHASQLPEPYLGFFQNLDPYFSLPHLLLVHAGFNFKSPDPFADTDAMFWIRGYEIDLHQINNKGIIHGHTPVPFEYIRQSVQNQDLKIDIDNGCAYPKPGLEGLVALNLDTFQLLRQENLD